MLLYESYQYLDKRESYHKPKLESKFPIVRPFLKASLRYMEILSNLLSYLTRLIAKAQAHRNHMLVLLHTAGPLYSI